MSDTTNIITMPVAEWPRYQTTISITAIVPTPDATAKVQATPFAYTADGQIAMGPPAPPLETASVYGLCARVPLMAHAIAAIKAADAQWAAVNAADRATLAAEQVAAESRLGAATAEAARLVQATQQQADAATAGPRQAVDDAKAAADSAEADRVAAYTARGLIADKTSDDYRAADIAYADAAAEAVRTARVHTTAQSTLATAIAAGQADIAAAKAAGEVVVTNAKATNDTRIKIAGAAVADTANPPLTAE